MYRLLWWSLTRYSFNLIWLIIPVTPILQVVLESNHMNGFSRKTNTERTKCATRPITYRDSFDLTLSFRRGPGHVYHFICGQLFWK